MDLIAKAMSERQSRLVGGATTDKKSQPRSALAAMSETATRVRTMVSKTAAMQLVATVVVSFLILVKLRPPFSQADGGSGKLSPGAVVFTVLICCLSSMAVAYYVRFIHYRRN